MSGGSSRSAHLEEEVDERKQLPAGPPRDVGPDGSEDAALKEAPALRAHGPCAGVRGAIAAVHVDGGAMHMPIVRLVHMYEFTKHDAT